MTGTLTLKWRTQLRVEVAMLRERLTALEADKDDLHRRLDRADEERRQAQERLTALLTDQRPARRRKWWPWG